MHKFKYFLFAVIFLSYIMDAVGNTYYSSAYCKGNPNISYICCKQGSSDGALLDEWVVSTPEGGSTRYPGFCPVGEFQDPNCQSDSAVSKEGGGRASNIADDCKARTGSSSEVTFLGASDTIRKYNNSTAKCKNNPKRVYSCCSKTTLGIFTNYFWVLYPAPNGKNCPDYSAPDYCNYSTSVWQSSAPNLDYDCGKDWGPAILY
ncbi:MAG: hypothetical protein K0R14_1722 [Burkholderiales bacterium]|jgi:hypothetical protein|nr:hypothetical protein [Burkholderiales bacterium]